ncbi:MAG: fimbrillin family protein [Bacteroidales bacterium]|nr:fimbrillin family protein [Bacteroidales bacterium]
MKSNTIYNIRSKGCAAMMAALAVFSACSDDLTNGTSLNGSGQKLELQANIQQENVSRANDNGFADGDQIGVFVVNYENETTAPVLQLSGNHADNVRFTYDDNEYKWNGSYQLYWKDNKTPIDVYGYYPFISQISSITEQPFSVERNQRDTKNGEKMSGYEKSDFLWAKAEHIAPTDATIILKHRHIMAGIEVTLVEGTGFADGEWTDAEKNVLVQNIVMAGTVNLRDGSVTPSGSAAGTSIIPQEAQGKYRAVVLPQSVAGGTPLFVVTVDGKAMPFSRSETMDYMRGKLHKFTFEVNKTATSGDYELKLLSDAIVNWENDPLSHNGTAREYITVHVEEGEYLGDVIKRMGISDPSLIKNLKLTGCIDRKDNFDYIRKSMPYLEAINLKELRTKDMPSRSHNAGGGTDEYGQPNYADDYLPSLAFENLLYLQYVVWPDHIKGIGNGALAGCPLRGSLILPEGLKYIGGDAFGAYGHQQNNLTGELYIPSTVEYIGNNIFGGYDSQLCYISGEVVLPHEMKYLGSAFFNCPRLTGTIRIPDGITEVNAFMAPNMTGDVIIPQGVKKVNGIGGQPSSIYFPEGVEEIGTLWSFDYNYGHVAYNSTPLRFLKGDLKLPSTLKKIGDGAFYGANISHVRIPEGIEIIPKYSFGYTSLTDTLTIPNSVVQIKESAFRNCKYLNAIILPENLTQIWGDCMNGCWSLDYIQCNAKEPPLVEGGEFTGIEKNNFTLVVPEGSVDAYRNAPGWKEFKRISAYRNFVCRPMKAKLLNKSNVRSVILNADGNWEMTSCPSWVHVDKTSGNKKTELSVTIDALAKGAGNREGEVVFTLKDKVDEKGNAITCNYVVQQFDYEHEEDSQVQLLKHTKGNGVKIVFIGDGYDAEDIATRAYLNDVEEGMEYFFGIEPYKTYKEYFDVYIDFPMSYESGVCSNVNIWRTTKFDTTYGAGNNGRLKVNFDDMMSYVMNDVAGTVVNAENVNKTLIISILNSDVYEGLTCMWSTGAAIAAVPHSRYGYPNDYRGLIQHEAGGHGFGKLADEYIYHRANIHRCPCICCPHVDDFNWGKSIGWYRNVSLNGRHREVDWSHLIFDDRYQDIVDIYEGGFYHSEGVYRSELNSCMNNNVPYYSTVSRQEMVERIMKYSGGTFDFETFVSKDSREMGDKFLTRSGSAGSSSQAIEGNAPIIVKGSPLKNLKRKVKYNTKKQIAR